jgi:hypothetical protein
MAGNKLRGPDIFDASSGNRVCFFLEVRETMAMHSTGRMLQWTAGRGLEPKLLPKRHTFRHLTDRFNYNRK